MSKMPSDAARPLCGRCEMLPERIAGAGTLHMSFPLTHSLGKVLAALKKTPDMWEERAGIITVRVTEGRLDAVFDTLAGALSAQERGGVKAMFLSAGEALDVQTALCADTLEALYCKSRGGWLIDMLGQNRITSLFQPILHADAERGVFAYECLLRGLENGKMVPPGRMLDVARGADMMFQLDLSARKSAIREAAAHGLKGRLFINFTPTSIYDPLFCLRTTMQAADEAGLRHEQIVFEVIESEEVADAAALKSILDYYRGQGFGVALDDLGSGYSSLNLLGDLRPDYVKLDMQLIRGVDADPYKAVIASKLLEVARDLGIRTVAEGVETPAEHAWLRANGADYVQGYLFAKPGSPPPLADRQGAALASPG